MTFEEAIHIIETEDTGEEVVTAIVAALQSLARRTTFEVDISDEITIIRDNVSGNNVRVAIRDALAKISAAIYRPYVVSFEWYETITEYNELETHNSNVLYAIGGTEGTTSSYERVFKGDVELQKVMQGNTMIWSKADIPPAFEFDETMITVVKLNPNYERLEIAYTSTNGTEINQYMINPDHSQDLYEIYYGYDWMENNGGYVTTGVATISNLGIITLPNNTVSLPSGYANQVAKLKRCDISNTKLTTIQGGTFYICPMLESVGTIPATVTQIIGGAFSELADGVNITIADGDSPLVINDGSFYNMNIATLGIPSRTTQIGSRGLQGSNISNMIIAKSTDSLTGYPWGATSIDNIWWWGAPVVD